MPTPVPSLTFVIPCKGRLGHLQQTLPKLLQALDAMQGKAQIKCLVVDYDCPAASADWIAANYPQVGLVRVRESPQFHIARARNVGAQQVSSVWIGFLDCDVIVSVEALRALVVLLEGKTMLLAQPDMHELAGFLICPTQAFRAAEGYDETFEGWGGEDRDLRLRLARIACKPIYLADGLLTPIRHQDVDRTAFYDVQDKFLSLRINSLYLQIKIDLARQMGVLQLSAEHRAGIYGQVKKIVLGNPEGPAQMEIKLPAQHDVAAPPGWHLARRWLYSFDPISSAQ